MLRVLTLATLFPNGLRPTLGGFVERQTQALAAQPGVEVQVVAPVGLPIWPLSLHPHYAPLRTLPPGGNDLDRHVGPCGETERLALDEAAEGRFRGTGEER